MWLVLPTVCDRTFASGGHLIRHRSRSLIRSMCQGSEAGAGRAEWAVAWLEIPLLPLSLRETDTRSWNYQHNSAQSLAKRGPFFGQDRGLQQPSFSALQPPPKLPRRPHGCPRIHDQITPHAFFWSLVCSSRCFTSDGGTR